MRKKVVNNILIVGILSYLHKQEIFGVFTRKVRDRNSLDTS